jgi:hypothetical protein
VSDELRDKIARLPAWAREHIRDLEKRADPNNAELRLARQQVRIYEERVTDMSDRLAAAVQVFQAAGRAGHETAQAFVDRILAEYCPPAEADDAAGQPGAKTAGA